MFGKKFKFTEDDLEKMIADALQEKPMRGGSAKPNLLQLLKSKSGLGGIRNERIQP